MACLNLKGFHVKNHSIAARSVTIAAAAALSLGIAPLVPANAQVGVVRTDGNVHVSDSTIDTSATGTLTIFKRANPAATQNPTGEAVNPVPGDALAGAGFTLYKVDGVDLSNNAGIAAASKLTVATAKQGAAVGTEQKTDASGKAYWGNLPVGAYILRETTTPKGYSPAADSLVFVPMTRANATNGGTQWLYDITAYPKNTTKEGPKKKVEDSGKNVGDTVKYTIDTTAQKITDGQKRSIYRIEDQLDPALTATADNVKVFKNGTELAAGDYTKSVENGKVVVYLNNPASLNNGDKITVTIDAKVTKKPANGDLQNKAQHYQNNPNDQQSYKPGDVPPNTPPEETPTIHTYYGGINFTKVNSDHKALADAEFQVYGTNEATCKNADAKADAKQSVNGTDTWKSGQDGKVVIDGLHANNIANMDSDGNTTPNKYTKYCLFETKSPKGYELLAEPIEFTLTANTQNNTVTASGIKVGNTAGEVVNLEDSTPKLPLTGGRGIGLLALIGGLIIAAGAFAAKRRSA